MKLERWHELLDQINETFELEEKGSYEDEEHGGTTTEYVVFDGPLGRLRLEFETHPLVLDTKTKYSNRIGSETKVEYIYSPTEKTHTLSVYKYDEAADEWLPFSNNLFK